jgi:acetyl esterase/lipase
MGNSRECRFIPSGANHPTALSRFRPTLPLILAVVTVFGLRSTAPLYSAEPAAARVPETITLWPKDHMPGRASAGPERESPSRGDNVIRLTDVIEPSIALFKVPNAPQPTPAVIICPGGGYNILAYDKEGTEIAAWLNTIGITGIVLKYRVPNNQDGAFQDLQRAMRLVRHHAADWKIAPNRIGVLGFSAGGHLSARLSTDAEQSTYSKLDVVDNEKLRPDFTVLIYPAYLSRVPGKLSGELSVNDKTPPAFIVHTEDDKSFVGGSKVFHEALEAVKVPNEFFLLPTGGHGYGLRSEKEIKVWPNKCRDWLMKQGFLDGSLP